jgi:hypothetical protein
MEESASPQPQKAKFQVQAPPSQTAAPRIASDPVDFQGNQPGTNVPRSEIGVVPPAKPVPFIGVGVVPPPNAK